jgi:hypothetical protein
MLLSNAGHQTINSRHPAVFLPHTILVNLSTRCLQTILKSLEGDLRKLMQPHTATNLKVEHPEHLQWIS